MTTTTKPDSPDYPDYLDLLPVGYDVEGSEFYIPSAAREYYTADRASLEGVYDLDSLAQYEGNFEHDSDSETNITPDERRAPVKARAAGRDALIARAMHRRAVQASLSRTAFTHTTTQHG